ncbi:hypothetical protein [Sinorhizobium meliloti]|uniref:hypothetical protein n=1 Tax=Rhizobium meliloti TaxID=382 RepID=UPI0004F5C373|nr:hypothetical protein [Sinorhizobium meliloti]AIL99462.1 hypothetical protein DU99_08625 [Sinorhizobium meliloti]MDW9532196.1 hypothetical protein [Sinorhizobium meliloti]MDW9618410.1 hypothetical protein [Sinorhizobium meliloti]RVE80167.1 hypothetical protein CN240_19630 [Sinorhizobium meliloti]RVG44169.1 hypothetical protein CN227_18365 [Sinorhizobium meliloti]
MADEEKKSVKPFPLEVNGARGEVALWVGDVPLVIAATMSGLAAVSTRLECKSFQELFMRLSGVEAAATLAGLELLTVRGDRLAAINELKLKHFKDCAAAFNTALAHHFDGGEGNAQAVDETAN